MSIFTTPAYAYAPVGMRKIRKGVGLQQLSR
jgi:hypothetical protein